MKNSLCAILFLITAAAFSWADPALPSADKPASLPPLGSLGDSTKSARRITIRGKFDSDVIKVQNGNLWIEHVAFEKPVEMTVNGSRWKPDWNGKTSSRFEFKSPLEPFGNATVQVKQVQGRSKLENVELPSAQNGQTLSIKVVDSPLGVDTYEIRIRW